MSMYNKSEFRFSETFNNSNGKTSGSGFVGVIMGIACVIGFLSGIIGWYLEKPLIIEFMDKILQFGGLAALLLGVRKVSSFFGKKEIEDSETKPEAKEASKVEVKTEIKKEPVIEKG